MIDYDQLTIHNPIKCEINSEEHSITTYGLDAPGILSHMVGWISLQGLEIVRAKSVNETHKDKMYFHDVFVVKTNNNSKETWDTQIPRLIEEQGKLIYANKRHEASQKIIEHIADNLAQHKYALCPPVVDIKIKEYENTFHISVQGEDTPFLLYLLSNAIETQSMSITSFSINTKQEFIEDLFEVQPIKKTGGVHNITQLRFRLMLNTQFAFLLQNAPNPYQAIIRFQDVINNLEIGEDQELLDLLISKKSASKNFAEVLGSGDLLWEELIRAQSHEIIKIFSDSTHAQIGRDISRYEEDLETELDSTTDYQEQIDILNKFKDQEVYLIDLEVMIKHRQDVRELSRRLSELAKAVVRQACFLVEKKLVKIHGIPRSSINNKSDWILCGLGKFGGTALGYASDIEILLIYEDKGETDGGTPLSNREFFDRFVKELCKTIRSRKDGIFTIDTRLRPHGESGPLAVRLSNFIEYYQLGQAHSVEVLALTRLRPIAGNPRLAERVLRIKNDILNTPDIIKRKDVFDIRKRQLHDRVRQGERNAKFGLGALADVEYSVQMLQIEYAANNKDLQQPSIHSALQELSNIGEISVEEACVLTEAYLFFRKLINALRMRRGTARDVALPVEGSWELEHLSRRMNYVSKDMSAGEQLLFDFDTISAQVYKFMNSHFDQQYIRSTNKEIHNPATLVFVDSEEQSMSLLKHFDNPEQILKLIKRCARVGEMQRLFSQVLLLGWVRILRTGEPDLVLLTFDKLISQFSDDSLIQLYKQLLKQPKSLSMLIDVFSASRFLSEEIIKNSDTVFYLINLQDFNKIKPLGSYLQDFDIFLEKHKTTYSYKTDIVLLQKNAIREFRKQESLRIIIRDICLKFPLNHICSEISSLARCLIQKAFDLACQEEAFRNSKDVAIFAFGKLGANELNYSSDLDLALVYRKSSSLSQQLLIKVFKNTIQNLTDYTSSGIAYRVDLRLRPFGEDGEIITNDIMWTQYYEKNARLWEIQASLRMTCVAGDKDFASELLAKLNAINHRRLSALNKQEILNQIHALRKVSVDTHFKKQDPIYEVKNSWGGIRDIEFSTQALQLLHYDSTLCGLSTIQALNYLVNKQFITNKEKQLRIESYLFLRKVEHFLQVYEDKQLHAIPQNNTTVIQRLSWLLLQEQDEDSFINKLTFIKQQAYEEYKKVMGVHA